MAYTSGRIRSMKDDGTILYAPTFGRVEARMMLPKGDGIWPAFWMLPATDKYGVWASSAKLTLWKQKAAFQTAHTELFILDSHGRETNIPEKCINFLKAT